MFRHQYCFLFTLMISYKISASLAIGYGSLFVGSILYADDITLLSGTCRGLQRMLDICSDFGYEWDIRFNQLKSQLLTLGGDNPIDC